MATEFCRYQEANGNIIYDGNSYFYVNLDNKKVGMAISKSSRHHFFFCLDCKDIVDDQSYAKFNMDKNAKTYIKLNQSMEKQHRHTCCQQGFEFVAKK